jgi:hypothetical protein
MSQNLWNTHDFKVRMLDWSVTRGSRLAHTCRRCGRAFCRFTLLSYGVWAIDRDGHPLEEAVTNQWLAEACPRTNIQSDDKDRQRLRDPAAQ